MPPAPTHRHRRRDPLARWLVAAVASLVVLAGCSGDETGDAGDAADTAAESVDRSEVVEMLARQVVVPGYERLAASTRDVATSTAELCAAPTSDSFAAARSAWDEAASAWASTAAYRFGPVESLRLGARISYEVDPDKVDELARDTDAPAPITVDSLEGRGADQRGLVAVEQLLFTPSEVAQLTARQCSYAAAAAELVARASEQVLAAWVDGVDGQPPVLEQLIDPGDEGMWSSDTEALEDLLNGSLAALGTVTDMQLGPTLDASAPEPEPEPDRGAAQRGLLDVRDELASVAAVFGDAGAPAPTGLAALVAARSDERAADRIGGDLRAAISEVDSVVAPTRPTDAVDERPALERADANARAVATALRTEVASLLGLTVSFSDADGDG